MALHETYIGALCGERRARYGGLFFMPQGCNPIKNERKKSFKAMRYLIMMLTYLFIMIIHCIAI